MLRRSRNSTTLHDTCGQLTYLIEACQIDLRVDRPSNWALADDRRRRQVLLWRVGSVGQARKKQNPGRGAGQDGKAKSCVHGPPSSMNACNLFHCRSIPELVNWGMVACTTRLTHRVASFIASRLAPSHAMADIITDTTAAHLLPTSPPPVQSWPESHRGTPDRTRSRAE